jgi:hypothetical protein
MVIDNDFVLSPVELVALTVKLLVSAVVGVPEISPVDPRLKPSGNAPLAMLHVMGGSPIAASVWLYAVPTVPFGNDVVVIVGAVPPLLPLLMVIDNDFVLFPVELVALTVKLLVSAVVGVPEITPVDPRLKPSGNDVPLSRLHVMGVSPVASSVWLYAVPTVPLGNDVVVITGAVPPLLLFMMIDNDFVLFPVELVALTVKLLVSAVVGVPEITPVASTRVNPTGNDAPLSMLHVMGVSPVASSV